MRLRRGAASTSAARAPCRSSVFVVIRTRCAAQQLCGVGRRCRRSTTAPWRDHPVPCTAYLAVAVPRRRHPHHRRRVRASGMRRSGEGGDQAPAARRRRDKSVGADGGDPDDDEGSPPPPKLSIGISLPGLPAMRSAEANDLLEKGGGCWRQWEMRLAQLKDADKFFRVAFMPCYGIFLAREVLADRGIRPRRPVKRRSREKIEGPQQSRRPRLARVLPLR